MSLVACCESFCDESVLATVDLDVSVVDDGLFLVLCETPFATFDSVVALLATLELGATAELLVVEALDVLCELATGSGLNPWIFRRIV